MAPVSSKKQRRAAQRKARKKRKRQALAQARDGDVKNELHSSEEETNDDEEEDEERQRLHEQWLEKERVAQEEFRLRCEKEEAARLRREEEERMIKQEWEAQQKREEEDREQRLQQRRGREETVQKMLDEAEQQLENGSWMNPEAPVLENSENFGTERDVDNCPFFLKTGSCRFGDRCSRKHVYPSSSRTLMVKGMFSIFGMDECRRDDYDSDAWLEHSEDDLQENFLAFYHDVLPEFRSVGKVVQFKVSCNHEPHLRGNVYVQFDKEEECRDALLRFNGRWYAGRQLQCELSVVSRWKSAICGLFDRKRCPKGKNCNFLHVFANPDDEFWEADRDLHLSPDRDRWTDRRRDGRQSERDRDKPWWSQRSDRSQSRRHDDRRGGTRTPRHTHRERDRSRSRERDRWKDRERDRSRSRERDRSRDRGRDRSRERERDRWKDRERDRLRDGSRERERDRSRARERHRSRSRTRSRSRSVDADTRDRSRSLSSEGDGGQKTADKNSEMRHRHKKKKHKKKQKKKKKKKKKRPSDEDEDESSAETDEQDEPADGLSQDKNQEQQSLEPADTSGQTGVGETVNERVC